MLCDLVRQEGPSQKLFYQGMPECYLEDCQLQLTVKSWNTASFLSLHKGKKIELNGFLKHSRTKRDMIVPS